MIHAMPKSFMATVTAMVIILKITLMYPDYGVMRVWKNIWMNTKNPGLVLIRMMYEGQIHLAKLKIELNIERNSENTMIIVEVQPWIKILLKYL